MLTPTPSGIIIRGSPCGAAIDIEARIVIRASKVRVIFTSCASSSELRLLFIPVWHTFYLPDFAVISLIVKYGTESRQIGSYIQDVSKAIWV